MDSAISIYKILSELNKVAFLTNEEMDKLIKSFGKDASKGSGYINLLQTDKYIKQIPDTGNWALTINGIRYLMEIEDKRRTEKLHRLQARGTIAATTIAFIALLVTYSQNACNNKKYYKHCTYSRWGNR